MSCKDLLLEKGEGKILPGEFTTKRISLRFFYSNCLNSRALIGLARLWSMRVLTIKMTRFATQRVRF